MELSQAEREVLAARLKRAVKEDFDGYANRAYVAAGVNSGTWSRLVEGLSVKDYTVTRVAKKLWPETGGDWRLIPGLTPGRREQIRADILSWRISEQARRRMLELLDEAVFEDEVRDTPTVEEPRNHTA